MRINSSRSKFNQFYALKINDFSLLSYDGYLNVDTQRWKESWLTINYFSPCYRHEQWAKKKNIWKFPHEFNNLVLQSPSNFPKISYLYLYNMYLINLRIFFFVLLCLALLTAVILRLLIISVKSVHLQVDAMLL